MSLRERSGHWHYRFKIAGISYASTTCLAATKQNLNAAKAIEAQARMNAAQGASSRLRKGLAFRVAGSEFLTWCHGTEYRRKPNSAKRISGSFASLIVFFGETPVDEIRGIDIERYKTFRSVEHQVKDVTLRNDLNALSLFFRYCVRAGWRTDNPLIGEQKVKRPSGEDAIRMYILTVQEEQRYFEAARTNKNLHDLAKLILLQGARPDEVLSLKKAAFDQERCVIRILGGKTRAAKRELNLCAESLEIIQRRMHTDGPWLFPSSKKLGCHVVLSSSSPMLTIRLVRRRSSVSFYMT